MTVEAGRARLLLLAGILILLIGVSVGLGVLIGSSTSEPVPCWMPEDR